MITQQVVDEAIAWNTKHHKPVLMSEYGADTVEGLHLVNTIELFSYLIQSLTLSFRFNSQLPAFVWSEEYQRELFSKHFKAFDILRRSGWFIGEFIWNFADFKTNQCTCCEHVLVRLHRPERV